MSVWESDSLFLQPRYRQVKHINLEFSEGIEGNHLQLVKSQVITSDYLYLSTCFGYSLGDV